MDWISLYFHTLRHLKPVQIYSRFKLRKPAPDLSPAPGLRGWRGSFVDPVRRPRSLFESNTFSFLNETHCLETAADWDDPGVDALWRYNLHYFDDLNAVGAENRSERHRELVDRWIRENPPAAGTGWDPYPTSLRIVNWVKWALRGFPLTDEMNFSLAVQVRHLARRLEYHLLGNHLMANAKALVFAGAYFSGPEAERWRSVGLEILERQLPEQVLPDGGHFERSPMYHAIILEDLLDLINLAQRDREMVDREVLDGWCQTAGRMMKWLSTMTHPDGEIVLFNDAAFNVAANPSELSAYAGRLGLEAPPVPGPGVIQLADSGYLRVQQDPFTAFLDTAPIGPDYIPGHAHADTLSFELSVEGHRVIVDSGTSCYGTGKERLRQRGTPAHNTVTIDGQNSSEVWSGFRVARRAYPRDLAIRQHDDEIEVACSHDGYRRLPGKPVHRREWRFRPGEIRIQDKIEGPFKEAVGRLHFHPEVQLRPLHDDWTSGQILLPDGRALSWQVEKGSARLLDTTYHPEFGISIPNACLEIPFEGPELEVVLRG